MTGHKTESVTAVAVSPHTWHFPVDGLYRVTSLLVDWIGVHLAIAHRCDVCTNPGTGGLCIESVGSTVVIAAFLI